MNWEQLIQTFGYPFIVVAVGLGSTGVPVSGEPILIERLWKFMRHKFCKDKYRHTFAQFCQQLDHFFANLDQYRAELMTLSTENFELVPPCWQAPASV